MIVGLSSRQYPFSMKPATPGALRYFDKELNDHVRNRRLHRQETSHHTPS